MVNRQLQHFDHASMNGLPLSRGEQIATFGGMHAGQVKNFRCIQIANAGDGSLIEQGHFDFPPAFAQPLAKRIRRKGERVGAEFSVAELLCELSFREQTNGTQSAPVPVPNVGNWTIRKVQSEAQVLPRRRIGDKDQSRHAWLKYQPITPFDSQDDSLSEPANCLDPSPTKPPRQHRTARLNRNRSSAALHALCSGNPAAGDARNAAAHGLNFRQFRHSTNGKRERAHR